MAQALGTIPGGALYFRGADARPALRSRSERRRLAPLWPAARIHQLQAEVQAENGLFPYVLLRSSSGVEFSAAARFRLEVTKLYQLHEQEREARAVQHQPRPVPVSGQPAYSCLSLERFRNAAKFHDRPAAADIAFCVAAISLRMPDDAIAATLEINYLSSDPNPSRRAAYIRRTMTKARSWAKR